MYRVIPVILYNHFRYYLNEESISRYTWVAANDKRKEPEGSRGVYQLLFFVQIKHIANGRQGLEVDYCVSHRNASSVGNSEILTMRWWNIQKSIEPGNTPFRRRAETE